MLLLALTALAFTNARADDNIGIVLSASPSGAATRAVTMRLAAEATSGNVPIFLGKTGDSTLYGVRLSATPLRDEDGVVSVTPTFDRDTRTIPPGGELRRVDVTVSGLKALGTFRSTLYATHGSRTQILGTLTVIHTRRSGELQIASIVRARGVQQLPLSATRVTLLMTVKNTSDVDASISAPAIAGLTFSGNETSQGDMPAVRVSARDGRSARGPFVVAAGDAITLRLVLDDVKRTGRYAGTLRVSSPGHEPVEQSFGFELKQGALLPAILIALGLAISYAIRRAYSSGRIGRVGQRRLVARLLSDLNGLRSDGELERREALILDTFERRLVDISDELELARFTKKTDVLSEIDHKIDLFLDFVVARRHVRALTPESLQAPFESVLDEVARFLAETTPGRALEARFGSLGQSVRELPAAVEATVRERFRSDVDRFLAAVEASPAVVEALPIRVLDRVEAAKGLAGGARFREARAELARAQLAFTRVLAEDLLARIPDHDTGPPGFVSGWSRFRATTVDALKALRRQRRGDQAAEAYRGIWQDYVIELSSRLKSSAARERRLATGTRKERLSRVVEACDDAASKAIDLDPASVDAYRVAVEGYLRAAGAKPGSPRLRAALDEAHIPPPLTVVAAGLGDVDGARRVTPSGAQSAASLTTQIRKRHWSLALIAAVVAIPSGLVLLWSRNDTWGNLADGVTIFAWGFGLHALAAIVDARRLGWALGRDAASVRRAESDVRATTGSSPILRPEREPG